MWKVSLLQMVSLFCATRNKNNLITSILNGIWFQLFQPIIVLDAFNQFEAMMIELETSLLLKLQNSYTNYPKKSETETILKFKQARRVSLQSICIERTCKSEYLYINPNYRVTSQLGPKKNPEIVFLPNLKKNLLHQTTVSRTSVSSHQVVVLNSTSGCSL